MSIHDPSEVPHVLTDAPPSQGTAAPSEDSPPGNGLTFRLLRFNPRRHARKAPAAELEVFEGGEPIDLLWMTPSDIRKNLALYPGDPGLAAALAAYATPAVEVPRVDR